MDKPKKLLSIDGGGIRGVIAAKILTKIKKIILAKINPKWPCLGKFFDFINGTSPVPSWQPDWPKE